MKLYEITAEYQQVVNELIENGGELTADLETQLTAIKESLEGKAEGICGAYQNLTAEAEAFKAESKRLAEQGKARENSANRLKDYLREQMEVLGLDKLKAGLFTPCLRMGPPSVGFIGDPDAIPAEFLVVAEPTINKRAVLAAYKADPNFPGHSVFEFISQKYLVIK